MLAITSRHHKILVGPWGLIVLTVPSVSFANAEQQKTTEHHYPWLLVILMHNISDYSFRQLNSVIDEASMILLSLTQI